MSLAYELARPALFCDLFLASFDTQRWRLYEALRWPLPKQSGAEEIATGEALTRFVQRGMTNQPVIWTQVKDAS